MLIYNTAIIVITGFYAGCTGTVQRVSPRFILPPEYLVYLSECPKDPYASIYAWITERDVRENRDGGGLK